MTATTNALLITQSVVVQHSLNELMMWIMLLFASYYDVNNTIIRTMMQKIGCIVCSLAHLCWQNIFLNNPKIICIFAPLMLRVKGIIILLRKHIVALFLRCETSTTPQRNKRDSVRWMHTKYVCVWKCDISLWSNSPIPYFVISWKSKPTWSEVRSNEWLHFLFISCVFEPCRK